MMTRIFASFLLLCAVSACSVKQTVEPEPPTKPNIIYIMADDLGYGDLGSYGQTVIQTPRIDRLAGEGLRFTGSYSGTTVCRPSRLVLWTGRHSGHTAINSNAAYHFELNETTVAELLQGAGYKTGGIGKWAMGGVGSTGHPNRNGFDYWFGYLDQGDAHNYYPTHLWENEEKVPLPGNILTEDPDDRGRVATQRVTYSHDVMVERMLSWIRANAESPFLFHAHFTIPHANNEGGRATGDGMEVPDYGIYSDRDWPSTEKGHAAMISLLDRDVGRLIDLLEELEIAERTLVIFTSDNGPHNEGGHDHTFFDSNGPLRGFKRDLYEGGVRVPMIAWWPGTIESGRTTDHLTGFQDFLPTACELAGLSPPSDIDGISYAPLLLGNENQQKVHDFLYIKYGEKESVRWMDWKAVRVSQDQPIELYDLAADVGEENNLAVDHPELVEKAAAMMAQAYNPPERSPEN